MKLEARTLVPPILAILVLFLTLRQTYEALHRSGAWQRRAATTARPVDPYAMLDAQIARPHLAVDTDGLRDPFRLGATSSPRPEVRRPGGPVSPQVPAPEPVPVLTSIAWSNDADPRATVRYNGRDYSISVNGLFDEFRVRSITSTQVVLERGGSPIVLTLRPKGE